MKKLLCVVCVSAAMLIPVFASAGAKEYEYTEQDIFITAGDHEIPATLTLPKGKADEKFPAVVMLHGNGSMRQVWPTITLRLKWHVPVLQPFGSITSETATARVIISTLPMIKASQML